MLADVEQMAEAIEEELERRALKGKSCFTLSIVTLRQLA
ncbi:unnamed protein product [Prunus brigantina]